MRRLAPLLLVVPVLLLASAPAGAAEDPVTGYWTKTRLDAPLPAQPPTPAPEGGSWISGDATGPLAVTAIRAGADAGSLVAGFRLPVGDAVGPVAVLVCPTTESWAAEQGGRFDVAPAADCSAPVEATVEEDVLVVDLPVELQADEVDLLLTPAPQSGFSLTLERATAEHVVQVPATSSGAGTPADENMTFEEWTPPAAGFDTGSSGAAGMPEIGLPATAPEPLLPAPALPEPAAAVAVPQPQSAPALLAPVPVRPAAVVDDRPVALLATALLVALGMLAVRLALQPAVAPRHLGGGARLSRPGRPVPGGPAAVTVARGVGRFRTPRVRPPVRI